MKNTWRYILKNKTYAFINLFGLTLGLSVSIFIMIYVKDELNYDKFLPGYERTFRVQPTLSDKDGSAQWSTTEGFVIPQLANSFPEIEAATRMLRLDNDIIFYQDSAIFSQGGAIAADSTLFKVFPFEFVYGDKNHALEDGGIVISDEVAKKFFGNDDPVGKTLNTSRHSLTVRGVFRESAENSHVHFKVIFPLNVWFPEADQSRNMYAFHSYVRLKEGNTPEEFYNKSLKDWYKLHGRSKDALTGDAEISFNAFPIADIHLQSHAEKEWEVNGQLELVYIFIAVAALLMIIATINYVNLSNAMAINRAKEVAVRKTIGASRQRLFLNFILDSYVFTFVAFLFSILIVVVLLPEFNLLTGKKLTYLYLTDTSFILTVVSVWIVLGFLSGFYPATVLSSFNPIQALKSNVRGGRSSKFSLNLRRGLIVFQFAISSFMIVSAFTIQDQLSFIENKNIGFNKNNVLVIPIAGPAREHVSSFKTEFGRLPVVESSAVSSVVPGKRVVYLTVRVPDAAGTDPDAEGNDDGTRNMRVLSIDHDFVETLGLQIVDGRDLSIDNAADAAEGFLLNEAAVKFFELKDPVGRPFEYVFGDQPKKGKVIGVVKDFNFASIHSEVEPLMMHYSPPFFSTISVKLKPGNLQSSIDQVERAWKNVTDQPFSYQFLDTQYDNLYRSEKATGKVMTYLTVLAVIIACLGLFGIVSFFVIQRTREVGIRKVFGATQISLFRVLSNEYVVMVVLGNAIAFYPAWLMAQRWLQQFAYRTEVSFVIFLMAFGVSAILAVVSISYVILKTAKANPAHILRSE